MRLEEENKLQAELDDKKRLYRDIFLRAKDSLVAKLRTIEGCEAKLDFLQNTVSKDILRKLAAIKSAANTLECGRCGACCRVATSEFSYSELLEKAAGGDVFAKSFTSVFVPNENVPKGEYDDYIALLKERGMLEQTHFYHCLKCETATVSSCSDYQNRPRVCRDFPNNPLVLLPPKCSYNAWRDEFEIEALFLNAMVELVGYFTDELGNGKMQ